MLAALLATAALSIASATAGAAGLAQANAPRAIPVTVEGGQGTTIGARPMVKVRVGHSRAVPLLLDTGSTGLRIFAPVVDTSPGSGVTVGSQRDVITYAGGHRLIGVVARAVIRIGRQATAERVPFSLVQRATCAPEKPTCPTAGGIAAAMRNGMYGVLGIGMGSGGHGVISPVLQMPPRLRRAWSLHLKGNAGALVLGAQPPARRSVAATLALPSRGASGDVAFWADQKARVCLTVGAVHTCVPGLFDSGTFQMQIWGSPLNTVPTGPVGTRVAVGTKVETSLLGASKPFWTFRAGSTKSKDTVTVHDGRPFVNFGVQAYYAFTVTYDDRKGQVVLSRRGGSRAARAGTS